MKHAFLIENPEIFPPVNKRHDISYLIEHEDSEFFIGRGTNGNHVLLGQGFTESDYESTGLGAVSRVHARIKYGWGELGKTFYIKDNNSTNGTYINGNRISSERWAVLTHEDKVSLGKYTMRFEAEEFPEQGNTNLQHPTQ